MTRRSTSKHCTKLAFLPRVGRTGGFCLDVIDRRDRLHFAAFGATARTSNEHERGIVASVARRFGITAVIFAAGSWRRLDVGRARGGERCGGWERGRGGWLDATGHGFGDEYGERSTGSRRVGGRVFAANEGAGSQQAEPGVGKWGQAKARFQLGQSVASTGGQRYQHTDRGAWSERVAHQAGQACKGCGYSSGDQRGERDCAAALDEASQIDYTCRVKHSTDKCSRPARRRRTTWVFSHEIAMHYLRGRRDWPSVQR